MYKNGSLSWFTYRGRHIMPAPFLVAGILNVTPDSFSDGGKHEDACTAYHAVLQMVEDGAHMVDIGAESTRPGAKGIGHEKEMKRLEALFSLLKNLPEEFDTCFSLDTFRAATAHKALESGFISVINDVGGGVLDPAMVEVVGHFNPGYVLGHCPDFPAVMQHSPQYDNVVDDIFCFFVDRMNILVKSGLDENKIALDPCIGFGKNLEHNLSLIQHAERFLELGRPLYYGISKKSLFRHLFGDDSVNRDTLTQITTALLASKGVSIHRVHDVCSTVKTLRIVEAVCSPLSIIKE